MKVENDNSESLNDYDAEFEETDDDMEVEKDGDDQCLKNLDLEELNKLNLSNNEWNELIKECTDREESYCNKYEGKNECYKATKTERSVIESEMEFTEDERNVKRFEQ